MITRGIEELLTSQQVCRILHCSRRTLYNSCHRYKTRPPVLPYIMVRSSIRFAGARSKVIFGGWKLDKACGHLLRPGNCRSLWLYARSRRRGKFKKRLHWLHHVIRAIEAFNRYWHEPGCGRCLDMCGNTGRACQVLTENVGQFHREPKQPRATCEQNGF
jgi:hypothetical protein